MPCCEALRPLTEKPLIVKLTPNVADPAAVAVAAEEGGADAVSLINTLKASAFDPASGEPALAAGHGGLSGPAVKPVALQQLRARLRRGRHPGDRHGGNRQRRRRRRIHRRGRNASLRSGPRAFAIRGPARGSLRSSNPHARWTRKCAVRTRPRLEV